MIFKWQEKYKDIDIYAIACFLALTIAGLMVSWEISLFTPLFGLFIAYFFVTRKSFSLPLSLWPFAIITLFYAVGIVLSKDIYYQNKQGGLNIIIGYMLGFVAWNVAKDLKSVNLLLKRALSFVFHTVALFSSFGVIKIVLTFLDIEVPFLWQGESYPFGTNLIANYNNNALAGFIGWVAGVAVVRQSKNQWYRLLNVVLMIPVTLNILGSGSRRSFLLLCTSVFIITALIIILLFNKDFRESLKQNWMSVSFVALFIFVSGLMVWNFTVRMQPKDRLEWVQRSPFNENRFTKETIKLAFRYYTLTVDEANIDDYYLNFWGRPYTRSSTGKAKTTKNAYVGRMARYKYAWQIFKSYSTAEKIFGAGFDYIDLFREKFLKPHGIDKEDYPHNFYISAILYSGILGIGILLLFTALMMWKLLRLLRSYPEFVIIVSLVFYNILFSYNSIFSLRLFVILMVLTLVAEQRLRKANEGSIAST